MEIYYKTDEEVQEVIQTMTELYKNKFCPIIKSKCIGENCSAFFAGSSVKLGYAIDKNKTWRLAAPGCCSPLITGCVELET